VLKKLGDGLMALFGYPQAQENDAERAVRAALAIQRALAEINAKNRGKGAPDLLARIGLESGPVVVEATGEVFGDAPNVAARVQAAAEPGSVLITLNIQRQVAGLFVAEEQGARVLKGVSEPVQLFRIVRASGGGRRSGARALTPFVGREEELGLLARRWERAKGGEGQLVLIVGEPGLGKSRLIEEFRSQLTETPHTWSEWSASQILQNTPLHPIAESVRQRFGVDAPAEKRLGDLENMLRLIGLDPAEHATLIAPLVDIPLPPERTASFAPEELRRRQLASMTALVLAGARSQPVVIAFEDLHWADPTSLDLLRGLADRGVQAPLLLLATARPEFRPPWSLRSHHSLISLSPLDRAGVARMVSEISALGNAAAVLRPPHFCYLLLGRRSINVRAVALDSVHFPPRARVAPRRSSQRSAGLSASNAVLAPSCRSGIVGACPRRLAHPVRHPRADADDRMRAVPPGYGRYERLGATLSRSR
jgi:hypothetical protein